MKPPRMRFLLLAIALAVVGAGGHGLAQAAPPANDTCAGAEVIPSSGPFPHVTSAVDITEATGAGDPAPGCQASFSGGVWWTFTPSVTSSYTISTCQNLAPGTTRADTVLGVFNATGGTCPAGSVVACSDNDSTCTGHTLQSTVATTLTGGTTYFIVAYSFGAVPSGAVQVSVQKAPANDVCSGATPLQLDTPVSGTTAAASHDYRLSGAGCFTGVGQTASTASGRDVSYSFTAPTAGPYSFKVTRFGTGNPVLYIASSCPTGTPPILVGSCLGAANRSSGTAEEVMCFSMGAGATVYGYVDENATTAGGSFILEVNRCARETESNNTTGTAQEPVCGMEGSITPGGDTDFYALAAPLAGARVFAFADTVAGNPAGADLRMRVTTTTDTLEFDEDDGDPLFGSAAPAIGGAPLTGASSFIRIDHNNAALQAEPYRLYSVVQPPPSRATPETEPNDTFGAPNPAGTGYYSGSLPGPTPSTDSDVYPVALAAGELLYVGLDADPLRDVTPLNARVELLDPSGGLLLFVNDTNTVSNATPSPGTLAGTTPASPSESLTYRAVAGGTYYVRVIVGSPAPVGSGTGDYLLSIAKQCESSGGADLSVVQSGGTDPVLPGDPIGLTLTVANAGPIKATGISLSNPIPADASFVSLSAPPGWGCSFPPVGGTGTISCTIAALPAGGTGVFDLVLRANQCAADQTVISNVATVSGATADPDGSNNSSTETTTTSGTPGSCDDGTACTTGDACVGTVCAGTPLNCDDQNPCTTDSCDPLSGCQHANNTLPCSDGTVCTQGDVCAGGVCSGTPISCDDGNICTGDSCDPVEGCQHANIASPCSDGNVCTSNDYCNNGACQSGTPNTVLCEDGDPCTRNDRCSNTVCVSGTPNNGAPCNDGNPCTIDDLCGGSGHCNGTPVDIPCNDNNACTVGDGCVDGECLPGAPRTCNDGNQCTADSCNPATGCVNTNISASCVDSNPCTTDSCNPATGCVHTNNTAPCNDNNPCTSNDTCGGGACLPGTPNTAPCSDGNLCTSNDTCSGGGCVAGPPTNCNDANPCTDDSCATLLGCLHSHNFQPCDDGSACTFDDACNGGTCSNGLPVNCDDGNPCTDDSCNPLTGCLHVNNTASCEDGNVCTSADVCSAGSCQPGTPNTDPCQDGNPCTTGDSCSGGSCQPGSPGTGEPCSDGNACTSNDTCQSGTCTGGPPTNCDDGNVCTNDSCDPGSGCVHTPNDSVPCEDGNVCTAGETCSAGVCGGGSPVDEIPCSDGNVCTSGETCTAGVCQNGAPNTDPCDDGNACTTVDVCGGGACVGSVPPDCSDGDVCTDDVCDPGTGCTHPFNTSPCNDANACTGGDTCAGGVCSGSTISCDDGALCTTDSCVPATGCVNANACAGGGACNVGTGLCEQVVATTSFQEGVDGYADTHDTWIQENTQTTNYGANALWQWDSRVQTANSQAVGLLQFGSVFGGSAGQVPAGARILSASLQITVFNGGVAPAGEVREARVGWSEGSVTWANFGGEAGVQADEIGPVLASAPLAIGTTTLDVTATVQSWSNAPATNFGWAYMPLSNDEVQARSSEQGTIAERPKLTVQYSTTVTCASSPECSDGNACNGIEQCVNGFCNPAASPNCDDGNVCTGDSCDTAVGCVHVPVPGSCSDGNACTTDDACSGGACVGGPPPNCDDLNGCTDDSCNPATGCVNAPNTNPCDDASACTTNDVCSGGACVGGPPPNCNDQNLCTDDGCNPMSGCTNVNNTIACTDGNACTTGDACSGGACVPGPPTNCDDANVCTTDSCDTVTGCGHTPVGGPCEDGNACTSGDACASGACVAGPPTNCDDSNGCTDDSCVPATGCQHANNSLSCSDGSVCTTTDQCSGGVCAPGPLVDCDDHNLCTNETCDPVTGCASAFNSFPCSDDNACTSGDACSSGACAGGPPISCDDSNGCTTDSCDPIFSCQNLNNTNPCEDGSACTTADACANGACVGGPPPNCDDGNGCTDDACQPATGCLNTNNTAPCTDGDACTFNDACAGGACIPGGPTNCDDANPCTDDSCAAATGCAHGYNTLTCSDGNACTEGDACFLGTCLGEMPADCTDGNPCTDDSCNPATGCERTNNTSPCDDGTLCTSGDVCAGGTCSGTPTTCEPGETCNPSTGECEPTQVGDGCTTAIQCSDGDPCTEDACSASLVCTNVFLDTDADGLCDALDNCHLTANALQENADGDAAGDICDCASADPNLYAAPGPAEHLLLEAGVATVLRWSAPAKPGGSAVLYDLLRSAQPSSFTGAAPSVVCVESGTTGTQAIDADPPPAAGSAWFYLVRAGNACGASLGASSQGAPRSGRSCP